MSEHTDPAPEECGDPSPAPDNDADLAVLTDLLQERGIQKVILRYDGSGDSGSVQEIEFHPENTSVPKWVEDRLCDLGDGYCPAGYENNEGGDGTLTIFPAEGLAELEHCPRFEDGEDMPIPNARLPKRLLRPLQKLGVTEIRADFDGYGDSGQFESFDVLPMNTEIGADLQGEIEEFLLHQLPGGWELEEGSYGTFTIDGESGAVTAEAASRYISYGETDFIRWKWRH